jgi:hypothetical protein
MSWTDEQLRSIGCVRTASNTGPPAQPDTVTARSHDYVIDVQPHDFEMNVSDRFVSLKLSESSDIDAVSEIADIVQPSVTKLDAGSSFATATHPGSGVERSGTVTITISREQAEALIYGTRHESQAVESDIFSAVRDALEER